MKKRILSIALSIVMLLSLLPITAGAVETHTHCVCGANDCSGAGHDPSRVWTEWTDELAGEQYGNNYYTATNSLPKAEGNYYLSANVTLTGQWSPADGTFLCLNGKSITTTYKSQPIIYVGSGVTFTLTDCGTETHEGYIDAGGAEPTYLWTTGTSAEESDVACNLTGGIITGCQTSCISVGSGTFNMYGGNITGNSSTLGAGVSVSGGKFNMYGGTIAGNKTTDDMYGRGGGVCIYTGDFTMSGGMIIGNKATATNRIGGGGVYLGSSNGYENTFNMTGGTITGNSASGKGGGGVCINYGTFTMSGTAEISNNSSGGVQMGTDADISNCTFNMTGGTISGNTRTSGGGVHVSKGTFEMSGGTISGNTATTENASDGGGGVIVAGGTFNMSGTAKITENTATNAWGGGVYASNKVFTMTGGTITGNSAIRGGGVYADNEDFTMSAGTISGNSAKEGGGVYTSGSSKGNFKMSGTAEISNNTTTGNGGGVYLSSGTFNMSGGTVSNNTAGQNGGGVRMNDGTFNMSGTAAISGNKAHSNGGGVCMDNGTFNISGSPSITGNTVNTGTVKNLRLNTDMVITVTGALTTDTNIGVSMKEYGVLTSGWNNHMSSVAEANIGEYFTADENSKEFFLKENEVNLGIPSYTVAFDTDGGSEVDTQTVSKGGKVTEPVSAPTKDDYTFDGWYADIGLTTPFNFETTTITGPITIYAKWRAMYSIDLKLNDVPVNNIAFPDASVLDTEDSITFKLHNTGDAEITNVTAVLSGAHADKFTLTFDTRNIGAGDSTDLIISTNNDLAAGTYGADLTIAGDKGNTLVISVSLTVTAKEYSIELDPDYGSETPAAVSVTQKAVTNNTVAPGSRTGYTFDGWFTAEGDKVYDAAGKYVVGPYWDADGKWVYDGVDGSLKLYAHWTANTYTVTFNPAGGTVTPTSKPVTFDADYPELPVPAERSGYTFGGWFTLADGEGVQIEAGDTVEITSNTELFAKWDAIPATAPTVGGSNLTLTYGYTEGSINVTATPADGHTIIGHQWYSNDTESDENGTPIPDAVENSYAIPTSKNAGTYYYYCVVTTKRTDNNETMTKASDVITVTIDKQAPTYTPPTAKSDLVYNNGFALELITAGTVTGGEMQYSLDNSNWNTAIPTGTNAGEYTVYYKVVGDANHSNIAAQSIGTVTIAKADMADITANSYSGTYDGAAHGITVNNVPDGATVTYSTDNTNYTFDNQFTAATNGAQTVYYKVSKANYNDFIGSATVTIDKATPNVTTWPTVNGTVYVNDEATLTGGTASVGGEFELAQTKWTTSGDKTVTVTFKPDDSTNYNDVVKADYAVEVVMRQVASVADQSDITDKLYGTAQNELGLPATVTITTADGKTFENVPVTWSSYNANTLDAQTLTGTLNLTAIAEEVEQPATAITASVVVDLQERTPGAYDYQSKAETYTGNPIPHEIPDLDGVVSIIYSYVGIGGTEYEASATAPTNAGTYQVTATFTMEDGYGAVAPKTANLTINKAEVVEPTISGTYTYNGEVQTATLSGVESFLTVTGNTQSNAGTHTITVTLDNNHVWADGSDGSVSWTIAPAAVTVTAKNQSVYVGQSAPDLSSPVKDTHYTVTGLFGEDTIDLSGIVMGYGETPDTSAAGTFEITISGAVGGTNYEVAYTAGALTVSTRPVAPSPSAPSTYKVEDKTPENSDGSINLSKGNAKNGEKVTITVTPDEYYRTEKVIVKDKNGIEIEVTANEDGTFSFKMPASKVTVEPVFSWDNPFTDVSEDAYYTPAVEWALKNDITNGTGDGTTFSPADSCTRAQMATFLWRAAGSPDPAGSSNPFADVSEDAYYAKAVQWAYEQGITDGTSDTTFSPDAACTRAQMVTFLHRVADTQKPEGNTNPFTDVPDAYYTEAVQWAYEQSITSGTSATTFSPDAICARGQMVTFLYRFFVK